MQTSAGKFHVVSERELIGERVRTRRQRRGWRQVDLANRMGQRHVPWTQSIVSGVEGGDRDLRMSEFSALCVIFRQSASELLRLEPDEVGHVFDGRTWPTGQVAVDRGDDGPYWPAWAIGDGLAASPATAWIDRRHGGPVDHAELPPDPMTLKLATAMGVPPITVHAAAAALYGHRPEREREERLAAANAAELPPRARQARRGHVSRQIRAELERAIEGAAAMDVTFTSSFTVKDAKGVPDAAR
ncbi:helix-turn-helix domain-containing protein [Kineococcus rubinsiae]|uniref:helix-turn-helix domain-containing protein n=1 Tax=Kineococcus rubinsiae TaxID=2609562 RepID=UPI001430035B|nr:helix-turn-helix domain-containing protein [Kineococcus rubinsiae]NIZ91576.1 helix-turn-helix domain-containing protein [Kineococcus rubinsiae]